MDLVKKLVWIIAFMVLLVGAAMAQTIISSAETKYFTDKGFTSATYSTKIVFTQKSITSFYVYKVVDKQGKVWTVFVSKPKMDLYASTVR